MHRCPVCQKAFQDLDGLRQHQGTKGHELTRKTPAWKRHAGKLVAAGVFAAVVTVAVLGRSRALPSVGSHWHARYAIEICGKRLRQQPYSAGDVHTHGDGLIHVHPASRATTGKAANLAAFFGSLGGRIGDSVLDVPRAGTHRNGDPCGDGRPGEVAVYVGGDRIDNPARYVPQDGDDVVIAFESPSPTEAADGPAR